MIKCSARSEAHTDRSKRQAWASSPSGATLAKSTIIASSSRYKSNAIKARNNPSATTTPTGSPAALEANVTRNGTVVANQSRPPAFATSRACSQKRADGRSGAVFRTASPAAAARASVRSCGISSAVASTFSRYAPVWSVRLRASRKASCVSSTHRVDRTHRAEAAYNALSMNSPSPRTTCVEKRPSNNPSPLPRTSTTPLVTQKAASARSPAPNKTSPRA